MYAGDTRVEAQLIAGRANVRPAVLGENEGCSLIDHGRVMLLGGLGGLQRNYIHNRLHKISLYNIIH